MSDIVKRLGDLSRYWGVESLKAMRMEAATEIDALRAIVSAVDERDPEKQSSWRYRREDLCEMARRALEPKI